MKKEIAFVCILIHLYKTLVNIYAGASKWARERWIFEVNYCIRSANN